jgi:hypothetical protein
MPNSPSTRRGCTKNWHILFLSTNLDLPWNLVFTPGLDTLAILGLALLGTT